MTTIAWDGQTLAGDRLTTAGSSKACEITKVFRRKDGDLIGLAGTVAVSAEFGRWFMKGEKGKSPGLGTTPKNGAEALIIRKKGPIEWHDSDGWHVVHDPQIAIGSGAMAAKAAMKMGAYADRAIEIASELDLHTGNKIDMVKH